VTLALRVSDGHDRATQAARLVVYQSDRPLSMPSKWKPSLPPIPWQSWMEQGFGFLVLWLVHLVGMNTLGNLQRWSLFKQSRAVAAGDESGEATPTGTVAEAEDAARAVRRRFARYKMIVRLASTAAAVSLAAWLAWPRT
jgi:hypothetical protein